MLRVPDVAAAIHGYERVGFRVEETDAALQPDGSIGWCSLCFEGASIRLRPGRRGDADGHGDLTLSFDVADARAVYDDVPPHAEVVYPPTGQGYRRVDFEVRDPHGYRLLFGHDSPPGEADG